MLSSRLRFGSKLTVSVHTSSIAHFFFPGLLLVYTSPTHTFEDRPPRPILNMSEEVDRSLPEVSEALAANGQGEFEEVSGDAGDDLGEESDEYDEDDIDEEEV